MPGARRPLTVRLSRTGDTLARAYFVRDHKIHATTASWSALGRGFRFGDAGGLEAIARLLDRGEERELVESFTRSKLTDVGELLFTTLFGDAAEASPVWRGVFDRPDGAEPTPIHDAVRVRISTMDPDLLGMPWRTTSWQAKRLVEGLKPWTFEVAAHEQESRAVHLPIPARILVVAPRVDGMRDLDTASHVAELRESVSAVSSRYDDPAYLRVVETQEDLVSAFRGMQPPLVYYYGHAEVEGGQACLCMAGADRKKRRLIMDDLARMMQPPPTAVFLNGCMSGASGWHSAGHKLSPGVPLVVSNRTTAWTGRAGPAAVRWLRDLLQGVDDPVALLDSIDAAESTQGFQWATTVVHTAYEHWTSGTTWASGTLDDEPRPRIGLRLDRQQQRTAALGQVSGLTQGRQKRVEAMIAYGETGNHVEQACEQVTDYLETHGHKIVRLKRLPLSFPATRTGLAGRLEQELRAALGCGPNDVLQYALRAYMPRADATRPMPLLWLDWGTFGPAAQALLTGPELSEWLEVGTTLLARECPAECRIVSFLSMIVAGEHHEKFERFFNKQRLEFTSDAFGCQLLPKLRGLEVIDIYEYLREPRNTRCPPTWARAMSELLHDETSGNYEATVALINEAEATTWVRLRAKLENKGGSPPPSKDLSFG